jgi:hypothetical protein
MGQQGRWIWLCLLILTMRADASDTYPSVVMETADAPGRVDQQKLDESVFWAVQELHLQGQPLPLIAVFHISSSAASRLGIGGSSLWRNGGDSKRYELWIVGEPSNQIYSQMAVSILERHFALGLDDARRTRAIREVFLRLDSTVSAKAVIPRVRARK